MLFCTFGSLFFQVKSKQNACFGTVMYVGRTAQYSSTREYNINIQLDIFVVVMACRLCRRVWQLFAGARATVLVVLTINIILLLGCCRIGVDMGASTLYWTLLSRCEICVAKTVWPVT